jgi:fibronectin-binding autotransporter adhesin
MFDKKNGLRPCAMAFAVASALGLSGCGGGGGTNVRPTPPPIVGSEFAGGNVNVNSGDVLVWPKDISGSFDLVKIGTGTLVLAGSDSYSGGTTVSAGTLQVGNGGTTGSITGNVTNNASLVFNRSDALAFGGIISGTGSLAQAGIGVLTLTGANTYAGGTTINSGTLQVGNGGTTGSITGNVTNNGSLLFNRSDDLAFGGIVSGTGSLTQAGSGVLTLTGANTYSGGTTISSGALQLGDGGTTGSIMGNVTNNGLLVFNRGDDLIFAGAITGTGALTKAGNGALTLTGANSYSGPTQVTNGSLYLDGDQTAAAGAINVAPGATLGGNGIAGGNVVLADGATLAPGSQSAIGTLTIHGDLQLSPGSSLDFTLGQANSVGGPFNDLVSVNGNLVLDGALNVNVAAGGNFGPGVYRLFNYTGTLTDNGLTSASIPSSSVLVQTVVAHQVNLINADGMTFSFWDGDAGPKDNRAIDGGDGTWESGSSLTAHNWTDANGAANATFSDGSFAVFQATAGTVTVNDSNGAVNAAGMQFASDGYLVQGDTIHLVGNAADPTHSVIRVGDGAVADGSYRATISNVLDGNSALIKTGAGTLVLTGANTYSGGTTIAAGTLQVGTGGMAGSIIGNVTNDGSLVFDRSGDPIFYGVFNGAISGTGSLLQTGTDTLILTGANTYSGGTTIRSGTLQIGNYATTGSIVGDVANNGSLVFARKDDTSFDGAVIGSGTLTKTGEGKLTLGGISTYTGGTKVDGGTLEIVSDTAVGTGTITVGIGGVYYFSDHILQIDSGVTLSNRILLGGGTLDNAGILGGTLDNVVEGPGTLGAVLNHDGGTIKGNVSAVKLDSTSTVKNYGGAIIAGGSLGVGLGEGGLVSNDGSGSIIRSETGNAIRVSGQTGTVENLGGGMISGGSTAIYLEHGGKVTNGFGSTIKTTAPTNGDCANAGSCSIFVASSDSVTSSSDGGLTLINQGAIIGNVQMIPTARNSATLSANGSIQGNLDMGTNGGSFLSLDGDAGTTQLYSTAVTGTTTFAGGLRKVGDGTWIIDNDNLHAVSHTEINGGTLQIGNGGTAGSIGQNTIQVFNGALVFDRSDDVTFAGSISGTLVQAGLGQLTLTDSLPFSDITIRQGTLQLGDGGALRDGNVHITNNGSLIFNHSNQVAINNVISGTGSFVKQGAGTLTLYAANTYTGDTTVNGGTLQVLGTLPGNVTVNAGGVLDGAAYFGVAPGVFQVAGDLSNAGTVAVHGRDATAARNYVQSSNGTLAVSLGSKLVVLSTATLNGGTLEVTGADSGYVSNAHTNVLTAGVAVNGTFDQLVKGPGVVFTSSTIQYDANSVWLDTTGLNVTTAAAGGGVGYTPASMGSAQRVQGAFVQLNDKIATGSLAGVSGDFLHAAGQFQQAPTLQAAQASLQSLSGQLHATSAAMTFKTIDASSRALSDRFDDVLARRTGFGMWTHDLSMGGDMARTGFDAVGFQLNGWLVGSDRQIGHSGVAGFAFGQSRSLQQLDGSVDRDLSRSTEGTMYAGWLNGNWYTQGHVGFGHFQQDVSRQLLLGTSTHGVRTQYNGNYNVAYGESGLRFGSGDSRVTPFVNLQYSRIDRGGFAEQGAGGFGLRSDSQRLDRWQAGLGARASHHWTLEGGRAVDFSARAQWQRNLASHGDVFDASFVGVQQWQPLLGIGLSRYSGVVGVAVDAKLSTNTTLKFGYDYETGERDNAQMLSARLNVAF